MIEPDTLSTFCHFLLTAREGNVFTRVCHSVYNRAYSYSFTAHPCYRVVGTHPTGILSCAVQKFITCKQIDKKTRKQKRSIHHLHNVVKRSVSGFVYQLFCTVNDIHNKNLLLIL